MTQKEMEEIDYALMGFLDKKSRLIVIEKMDEIGFTQRPQDNNALVPLDFELVKIFFQDRWTYLENEVGASTTTLTIYRGLIEILQVVCAKFGKDNNETIAGSSFKFLNNKEEDIYTFEDGKPIGKDNSGMVLIDKLISMSFELGVLSMKHGDARDLCREVVFWEAKFNLTKEDIQDLTSVIELMDSRGMALMKLRNKITSKFSQQPPKERKVSLEDIYIALCLECGNKERGDLLNNKEKENELWRYSQAILSLLNAVLDGKEGG